MTVRAPEMRIVRGWGTEIADARQARVTVDGEGVLRLFRAGIPPVIVTSASSATRAIWLSPADTRTLLGAWPGRAFGSLADRLPRRVLKRWIGPLADPWADGSDIFHPMSYSGAIVIFEGAEPVWVCPLHEFVPWAGDQSERRETSGAVAVVRALGLVLDARTPDDVLEPRVLRSATFALSPGRLAVQSSTLLLSLVAGVLAFLTWPFGGSGTGVVIGLCSLLAAAWPVSAFVRSRRAFLSIVATPPALDGRAVYHLPRSRVGESFAQLQLGSQDVVIVTGAGEEVWLPGPALGGVHLFHVADDDIHLKDEQGRILHVMTSTDVVPDPELRPVLAAACAEAGINHLDDAMWIATINVPVRFVHDDVNPPGLSRSAWSRGAVVEVLDDFLLLGAVMLMFGGVAAAVSQPSWGWLVLVGAAGWLAARLWTGQAYRRWRRGVLRGQAVR